MKLRERRKNSEQRRRRRAVCAPRGETQFKSLSNCVFSSSCAPRMAAGEHTHSLALDGMGAFERQYFNLKAFTGSRDDNFSPAPSPLSPGPHTLAITTHIHTLARSRAIIQRHKLSAGWVYMGPGKDSKSGASSTKIRCVREKSPASCLATPQHRGCVELIKRV